MKILLIYPEFPNTFWSYKYALKFILKKAALPPLGLLTIASMLPEHWDKKVIDLNIKRLSNRDLEWADLVFISAMIAQQDSTKLILQRCDSAGKTVVAGGPLFTLRHDLFPEVCYFVLNEAEVTLPEFLSDYQAGKARHVYENHELPDLNKTPTPLWNRSDFRHYASLSVQYSRGCPFDCDFCSVTTLFGHRARIKPADSIIQELDAMWSLGWRGPVFFVDDNFIGNKRILKSELLPALIQWKDSGKHFRFYTEASINLADDMELMKMMVIAGFDQVFIGIETPDENSLVECNKAQNRHRDLIRDVKCMQQAGLQVQGGFIVGFDSDRVSIFQQQAEFIQQSGIVTAMMGLLQAIPGTKLYTRLSQQGRLLGESTGDNVDGSTNFNPAMDHELLTNGYRKLLAYLYAPQQYYTRIRNFLKDFHPIKTRADYSWRNFHAFFAAGFRLGILGKERFHYWPLLIWTLCRHPKKLSMAIELSIQGFHYRKCCQHIEIPIRTAKNGIGWETET